MALEKRSSLNAVAHTVDMDVQTIGAGPYRQIQFVWPCREGVSITYKCIHTVRWKHLLRFGISTVPGSIGWMQDNTGCLLGIFSVTGA